MIAALASLLQSPWIAALLLMVLLLEGVGLFVFWSRTGRGISPMQLVSFLGAGTGFALALGAVLADMAPAIVGFALALAFFFHLLDLKLRWQS